MRFRAAAGLSAAFATVVCVWAGAADLRDRNRTNLNRLSVGMTKGDVLSLMGTESVKIHVEGLGLLTKKETVTNPFRTETIMSGDGSETFEVLFYYTDVKAKDGVIADNELTPLAFGKGTLIGWGWPFVVQLARTKGIPVPPEWENTFQPRESATTLQLYDGGRT